jgi:hypothetical protein
MFAKLINRVATALAAEVHRLEQQEREAAAARLDRLSVNPFHKAGPGWNLTEQSRLLVSEPERAQELAAEAGVQIPEGPHEYIRPSLILQRGGRKDSLREVHEVIPVEHPPKGWLNAKPKKRRHLRVAKTRTRKAA